jgi:hypothetical protein
MRLKVLYSSMGMGFGAISNGSSTYIIGSYTPLLIPAHHQSSSSSPWKCSSLSWLLFSILDELTWRLVHLRFLCCLLRFDVTSVVASFSFSTSSESLGMFLSFLLLLVSCSFPQVIVSAIHCTCGMRNLPLICHINGWLVCCGYSAS